MSKLPASIFRLPHPRIPTSRSNSVAPLASQFISPPPCARRLSTLRPPPRNLHFVQSNFRPTTLRRTVHQHRANSSLSAPSSSTAPPAEDLQPTYQLTFTCKPCGHRSSHRVTKQGYHNGTVLIQCPGCKNRHVIADHLKVFLDQKSTLEDILKKKTQVGKPLTNLIKKGQLGIRQGSIVGNEGEEDVEFWEDGTETIHEKPANNT